MSRSVSQAILFTGGNTGGHVIPNIPLIKEFQRLGWNIYYIGSKNGIEAKLIPKLGIRFYAISTGKWRRYFDLRNIPDIFATLRGIIQALEIIKKNPVRIIFAKGGFVSVPVIIAGWLLRVPVVVHESDITLSFTGRITLPFARRMCCGFPETKNLYRNKKIVVTGIPLRQELLTGDRVKGLRLAGFTDAKPVLLISGGSIGAQKINAVVRKSLPQLLDRFQILHICGYGNIDATLKERIGYKQFEFVENEYADLVAASTIVISRAGATQLWELAAMKKPSLLIPLSRHASRGEQIANAEYFRRLGYAEVLPEEHITPASLVERIKKTYQYRERIQTALGKNAHNGTEATSHIKNIILEVVARA